MTKKHDNTTSHKNAIAKYGAWLTTKKIGSVLIQINNQVKEQVIKNRAILTCNKVCFILCTARYRTTKTSKRKKRRI